MNDEQMEAMLLAILEKMEEKKKMEAEEAKAIQAQQIKEGALNVAGKFGSELVKGLALGAGLALTLF